MNLRIESCNFIYKKKTYNIDITRENMEDVIIDYDKHITKYNCYKANVTKVYDGDTVTLDIDIGFDLKLGSQSCRLFGINTPEVRGEEREKGLISRDYLRNLISDKEIDIYCINNGDRGKYGRLLIIIYYNDENINKLLVTNGYALYKKY